MVCSSFSPFIRTVGSFLLSNSFLFCILLFCLSSSTLQSVFFPTFIFCFQPALYYFQHFVSLTVIMSYLSSFPSSLFLQLHYPCRNFTVVNSRAVTNHQCCCKIMPSAICRHIKFCLTFTFVFIGKDKQIFFFSVYCFSTQGYNSQKSFSNRYISFFLCHCCCCDNFSSIPVFSRRHHGAKSENLWILTIYGSFE